MDLYNLFTNIHTAELIYNLSVQIIVLSILGWSAMHLWKPRSAPARSSGYLAVMVSLAAIPFFTLMFISGQVTWFQSTIKLPQGSLKQEAAYFIPVPEIVNQKKTAVTGNASHEISETPNEERSTMPFIPETLIDSETLNEGKTAVTNHGQHESLHSQYEEIYSSILEKNEILIPEAVEQGHAREISGITHPEMPASLSDNSKPFFTQERIILTVNLFGLIWLTGFIVFLLRLGFKLSFLKGYMHNLCTDNNERLKRIYNTIKHVFNDRPMPVIYFSPSLSSPVTVGIIKPVIILPVEMQRATDDELKSILLHELAHIFHRDNFIGFLQHLLSAVFWWNPLVYLVNSGFSDTREDICDNYALKLLKSPKRYADTLVTLLEKQYLFSRMPATTGMSLSRRSFEHRVIALLRPDRDLSTIYKPSFLLFSLIAAIVLSACAPGIRLNFKAADTPLYTDNTPDAGLGYSIDSSPGKGWSKQLNLNDMAFLLPDKASMIYVGRIPVNDKNKELPPEEIFMAWSNVMQDKYRYEDFKIESSGTTPIDNLESYYAVYEFIYGNIIKKEKVYFIRGESSFYRLRYSCPKVNYMDNLETFERYVKSFELKS